MFTRRKTLLMGGGVLTLGLSAGCQPVSTDSVESKPIDIQPGQARLLIQEDGRQVSELSGLYEGRAFTLDSPFRIASISKLLVGELARRLHADGALDEAEVTAAEEAGLMPLAPNEG
jgi:hypothetical protein